MLDYGQTKKLIDFAVTQSKWPPIEEFMLRQFQIKPGPRSLAIYQDSIQGHANLLDGLKPNLLERILGFMNKRMLSGSPLKNKLSPDQQQKLQVANAEATMATAKFDYPILNEVLAADPSAQPPKKWWNKMKKEIKEGNPDYSADRVDKTIGDIWYHKLDDAKRKEIRGREGKKYRPAAALAGVLDKYPTIDWVLAESDDRKAQPGNDVIYEVDPLKWKQPKPGQSAPMNMPANPDAKNPEEEMTGLPKEAEAGRISELREENKGAPKKPAPPAKPPGLENVKNHPQKYAEMALEFPAVASALAGEEITMPKEEFTKEHEHLLKVLQNPTPESLKKEHDKQKKEVEDYGIHIKE